MDVIWHRWPDEKPESGEYWIVESVSKRAAGCGYMLGMGYYSADYDVWSEDDDDCTYIVLAWAEIEYPQLPALSVKLRSNGRPLSVEWL